MAGRLRPTLNQSLPTLNQDRGLWGAWAPGPWVSHFPYPGQLRRGIRHAPATTSRHCMYPMSGMHPMSGMEPASGMHPMSGHSSPPLPPCFTPLHSAPQSPPKVPQRHPKATHGAPKRPQRAPKGSPRGSKGAPRGPPGGPKSPQGTPKGSQKDLQGEV